MITLPDWFYIVFCQGGCALSGFFAGYVWGEADERRRQRRKEIHAAFGVPPTSRREGR